MKISYVLLLTCFFWRTSFGQMNESFSDHELTSGPAWQGDTSYFIVNESLQLQSEGPAASAEISISCPSSRLGNTLWEFYVMLGFDPSASNYAKIYLASDNPDLKGSMKGYFVRIGGESGTADGIDLYRQNGMTDTKLDGIPGHAGKPVNTLRIQVIRDDAGKWMLFSDTTGGRNFLPEGSCLDTSFSESGFFGISCIHTSTRRDLFFFDDFLIKEAPLGITGVRAYGDSSIALTLNNPVDPSSAKDPANYILQNYGNPEQVLLMQNQKEIILQLADPLAPGSYTLSAINLQDTGGETYSFYDIPFTFRKRLHYADLLITEIFPNPAFSLGLPAAEFVELYNATNDTIDLTGFSLADPSTTSFFPSRKIAPLSYLIVTSAQGFGAYQGYGTTIALNPWPSLNNSSDDIYLKDENQKILFNLDYSDQWYETTEKKAGGWSLEMIHLMEYCKKSLDWTSSRNSQGGTPGTVNSVNTILADTTAPAIVSYTISDSATIEIFFSEPADSATSQPVCTLADNSIVRLAYPAPQQMTVHLKNPLAAGSQTTLTFQGISDCLGNKMTPSELIIIRPDKEEAGDIILNEILFNPRPYGEDFIEIYNRSGKYINLENWVLASLSGEGTLTKQSLFTSRYILKPFEYLVFCTSLPLLEQQYKIPYPDRVSEIRALPAYGDKEGTALLINAGDKIIDRLDYKESYQSPLLDNPEGVSLERISFFAPTNSQGNWCSASATSGYATPGYENSQHLENTYSREVEIDPKIITPNGDNYKDLAFIKFLFPESGNICDITIFNASGQPIRSLCRNARVGVKDFFYWDGTNDGGELVNTGTYIILGEIFNPSGNKYSFKETVTVGNGF